MCCRLFVSPSAVNLLLAFRLSKDRGRNKGALSRSRQFNKVATDFQHPFQRLYTGKYKTTGTVHFRGWSLPFSSGQQWYFRSSKSKRTSSSGRFSRSAASDPKLFVTGRLPKDRWGSAAKRDSQTSQEPRINQHLVHTIFQLSFEHGPC